MTAGIGAQGGQGGGQWAEEGKGRTHCCCNCLVGGYREEKAILCSEMHSNRMRGNRHMLECRKSLGTRKNFCHMRMVTILK